MVSRLVSTSGITSSNLVTLTLASRVVQTKVETTVHKVNRLRRKNVQWEEKRAFYTGFSIMILQLSNQLSYIGLIPIIQPTSYIVTSLIIVI